MLALPFMLALCTAKADSMFPYSNPAGPPTDTIYHGQKSDPAFLPPSLRRFLRRNYTNANFEFDGIAPLSINHLSESIRFRTVSSEIMHKKDSTEFEAFQKYLQQTYPLTHAMLDYERVAGLSLLYHWHGRNPRLKPIILLAHMDVVPVETSGTSEWKEPAFSGTVTDSFIWGRGTMDDKVGVVSIMEAVELLLSKGYQPRRDIYLAFSHDEESANNGAQQISALLEERGIHFEMLLDEGGGIADGIIPDVKDPFAFIGVAEKGYLSLELTVSAEGGHSSAPSLQSAAGILGSAISKLEANQFPRRIITPVRQMLKETGEKMPPVQGFVARHALFFAKLIKSQLSNNAVSRSLIQTTTATTVFESGIKENVLPTSARSIVNFRILPGENIKSVMMRVKRTIGDKRVKIAALPGATDPPKVTGTKTESYRMLRKTILQLYPTVTVSPALTITTSDSRFYSKLTDNILRFVPLWVHKEDTQRIHGQNERIPIDQYQKSIHFYYQLVLNSDKDL